MPAQELAITGAGGFVGGTLLSRLGAGWSGRGLVRSPAPADARLRAVPSWTEEALDAALEGATAVVHAASVVHRPETPDADYVAFNVEGTRALIAACRRRGIRRLVYLSTIKVYGEAPPATIDEETSPAPEGAYARTKLDAERLVLEATRDGALDGVILRLCPVFGVGDKGNVRTMIRAIARGRFAVPGDGSTRKSLVHVSTVCDGVLAALASSTTGTFVLADEEAPSMGVLADTISTALGRRPTRRVPIPLMYAGAAAFELVARLRGRPASINRDLIRKSLIPTICSPARFTRTFGVHCHVDLRQAIEEEVAWVRSVDRLPERR